MIKLDKRLLSIINEIEGKKLADIGADHGKVVVSAVLAQKVERAVAVDISEKSLQKAKKLAQKNNVEDRINFVVGDGLHNVDSDVDCIVIAGMGGNEISKIMSEKNIDAKYIFVPHQDNFLLRRYLMDNGFSIEKDFVVEEGMRFYDIIVARKGESNYKQDELYLGKNMPSTEAFYKKLQVRKKRIEEITKAAKGYENISVELRCEWEEMSRWDI